MNTSKKIIAIIVTYHPELAVLIRLLDAISHQVHAIVVVDNGSNESLSACFVKRKQANEYLISLGKNYGIAAAQNRGIEWARRHNADYVVLFDQDSEPAPDMVEQLVSVAEAKLAAGVPVASLGPRYFDERQNNPPPFIQVKGLKVERQACPYPDTVVEVDYLIASGCLIPMSALDKVGGMREELFIDYVDIEWGLRAKTHGLQSFGVCGATMKHSLGDEPVEFFGRKVPIHSPLRHYYHFRNAVWMYRQPLIPLHWRFADGLRLILRYGFYTLFAKPRTAHFKMMTLGMWHGLREKMGMFEVVKQSRRAGQRAG